MHRVALHSRLATRAMISSEASPSRSPRTLPGHDPLASRAVLHALDPRNGVLPNESDRLGVLQGHVQVRHQPVDAAALDSRPVALCLVLVDGLRGQGRNPLAFAPLSLQVSWRLFAACPRQGLLFKESGRGQIRRDHLPERGDRPWVTNGALAPAELPLALGCPRFAVHEPVNRREMRRGPCGAMRT